MSVRRVADGRTTGDSADLLPLFAFDGLVRVWYTRRGETESRIFFFSLSYLEEKARERRHTSDTSNNGAGINNERYVGLIRNRSKRQSARAGEPRGEYRGKEQRLYLGCDAYPYLFPRSGSTLGVLLIINDVNNKILINKATEKGFRDIYRVWMKGRANDRKFRWLLHTDSLTSAMQFLQCGHVRKNSNYPWNSREG